MTVTALHQTRLGQRLAGIFLAASLLHGAPFAPGQSPQEPPLPGQHYEEVEPTVSEEEAALLRAAQAAAETDPGEAVRLLRGAITDRSSAALPFALAAYLLRQDQGPAAIAALESALERLPRFRRARRSLAHALVGAERHEEALVHLRQLALDPGADAAETWRLLAYCLQAEGRSLAAEAAYRHALVQAPDDRELKLGLLKVVLDQGRQAAAAELAAVILPEYPENAQLWRIAANAALAQGDGLGGLVFLESARRLALADSPMLAAIGDLYLEQGLAGPALVAYREAANLDAAPVGRILRGVEAMLALGQTQEAGELLGVLKGSADALLEPEQSVHLQRLQANLALRTGDRAAARTILSALVAADPLDGKSLLQLGDLLRESADLAGAAAVYERAAVLPEYAVQALTGLAQTAVERGEYALALRHVQEALKAGPNPALERYMNQLRELL